MYCRRDDNGYAAQEILSTLGQEKDFKRYRFFRGITLPPNRPITSTGRIPDEGKFPGDVIIKDGLFLKGKTIYDIVDNLREGDVILKGANAIDIIHRRAAILIGDPKAGTIGVSIAGNGWPPRQVDFSGWIGKASLRKS